MKNPVLQIALALIVLISATPIVHAQSADVTGGSFTITLDPTLWALMDTNGINTTLGPVEGNVPHSDTIVSGIFDLTSACGYFMTKGQLKFAGPAGREVTVLQLSVDTTGPIPVVFGYVYADGYYYNRMPIFNILTANPLKAPLKLGTDKSTDILATLSPAFQAMLTKSFQTTALLGYRGITTLHTSISLTPAQ